MHRPPELHLGAKSQSECGRMTLRGSVAGPQGRQGRKEARDWVRDHCFDHCRVPGVERKGQM